MSNYLNETIKNMILQYPGLFKTRLDCLVDIFLSTTQYEIDDEGYFVDTDHFYKGGEHISVQEIKSFARTSSERHEFETIFYDIDNLVKSTGYTSKSAKEAVLRFATTNLDQTFLSNIPLHLHNDFIEGAVELCEVIVSEYKMQGYADNGKLTQLNEIRRRIDPKLDPRVTQAYDNALREVIESRKLPVDGEEDSQPVNGLRVHKHNLRFELDNMGYNVLARPTDNGVKVYTHRGPFGEYAGAKKAFCIVRNLANDMVELTFENEVKL